MPWPPVSNEFVQWEQREVRWMELIKSVAGFGAIDTPKGRKAAYLDLIAPQESAVMRDSMARMSGCALVVRGLWRLYGVASERLWKPYKIGAAVSDVVAIGREFKALLPMDTEPKPGDVVLVGSNDISKKQRYGCPEHVLIVTDFSDDKCTSIDGGQLEKKLQAVKRVTRQVIRPRGQVWIGDRRVMNVISMPLVFPSKPQFLPSVKI